MKLKRIPEDFQVDELSEITPAGGDYALYRMTKKTLGTPEAVDRILTRLKVQRHRVSYGGLKDKHALTTQFVTIRFGPRSGFQSEGLSLEYLGQFDRAFTPQLIAGNRFQIVLRDLSQPALEKGEKALAEVQHCGFPNYFDDQRFGSLGASGEFIAKSWCLGNYERALWLALADHNPDDRKEEREQKTIMRDLWGKWRECKAALARSHRRSIVTYLADKPIDQPDYKGAFARIRVDMRSLYLSAFQSFLWNQMLVKTLADEIPSDQCFPVDVKTGPLTFYRTSAIDLIERLRGLQLPLPSARLHLPDGPELDRVEQVVRAAGMELRDLRVKHPRDSFFSKGNRLAIIVPNGVGSESADDDLYPKRRKLTLRFDLPRGSYATVLVKRITEC